MSADDKSMPNIRVKPPALKAPVVHPPASSPLTRDIDAPIRGTLQAGTVESAAKLPLSPTRAVIVFHGIGDEVRYDTLSRVVAMLVEEVKANTGQTPAIQISSVPRVSASGGLEVRSELSWSDPTEGDREVHVYECYWAPLTAGRVNYWDTMLFLLSAGVRGLQFACKKSFPRWLFGGFKDLKITKSTTTLLIVLLVMITFIMLAIAMALAAVAGVARQIGNGVSTVQQLEGAVTFIYGQIAQPWNGFISALQWIFKSLHWVSPDHLQFLLLSQKPSWAWYGLQTAIIFLVWAGGVGLALRFQQILTLFAGSLVAYLSPFEDSKWEDLRYEIQQRGLDVANTVYHGYEKSGWIPRYGRVVILGHSLGSVIAYDTLNAMINLQAASLPAGTANPVVQRTGSLITFGSPLDKTAFLFRLQFKPKRERMETESDYREAMASAIQPLITDYTAHRFNPGPPRMGPKWINIWSPKDIVSGSLDYYDDPDDVAQNPGNPKFVENVIDQDANKWNDWIVAHLQYWTNPLLRQRAYSELFPATPRSAVSSSLSEQH